MYLILTVDKSLCVAIGKNLDEIIESAARVRAIERAKPIVRRVMYAGYHRTPEGYLQRMGGALRVIA